MAREYIRTDRNGTKIYHDYTCNRCGGRGWWEGWVYTGGTCYKCGGSGKQPDPTVYKEYTPEYRAKLDARAAKRREQQMAKAQAEKAEKQAEWKQLKGFVNDRIHVVSIERSYDLKDRIKAAGGRYNEQAGWYFSEPCEEFQTVEITAEEALVEDAWGKLEWRSTIRETVKAKRPAPENPSEHVGTVGDKVELDATLTRRSYYDTRFGTTWVLVFADAEQNVLVWKTSTYPELEIGDRIRVKGTVKGHDEYNGIKQTVLTRCKIA